MILLEPDACPLIAHRGASGECPENTLLSFRRGLEQGADALELDVRVSADGIPVVIHDRDVDRTTNASGPVGGFSTTELAALDAGEGQQIPTLEQVLSDFPDTPIIIEVKEAAASGPVAAVIKSQGASERVLVGSFEHAALRAFGRDGYHRAASRRETAAFWLLSRAGIRTRSERYEAFTVPVKHGRITVADGSFAKTAERCGKPVHVWTVDDRAEAERLRRLGVRGIITNFPERMRGLRSA
jgi:glycerophosphoryl diester phosphodiesterase